MCFLYVTQCNYSIPADKQVVQFLKGWGVVVCVAILCTHTCSVKLIWTSKGTDVFQSEKEKKR